MAVINGFYQQALMHHDYLSMNDNAIFRGVRGGAGRCGGEAGVRRGGHSNLRTTLRYVGVDHSMITEAMGRLDS